ncbi:VOC family protein [Streptomyces hoynatensis]|uniref:VOC family protein n=1 Tax=Streptomyces hoynatensis TaxID=1141874 RepID=A0A3A9YN12_9ACTN|nr:VOC family protein [Streptomyces hoynatensis]RKN37503.1 VOC family protein [Streptomyces hoynatensis]
MITTDFLPGSPCWLDLGCPEVSAGAAFYRSVFGWDFRSSGPDATGYGVFQLEGATVAALGPLTERGARSAWMIYFRVPDARASAEAVERLGGSVRVAPVDAGGWGRMGQFTDPLGAEFAVWQPGRSLGLELVDQPGSLSWVELYTTDGEAARRFYGELFGWQIHDIPLPGGTGAYALISPAGAGQERMQGGMMQLPADSLARTGGRPYWHPVFAVANCDETVTRVARGGGSVQLGPEDAEGVGRLAVCLDPYAADFVVLAPAP